MQECFNIPQNHADFPCFFLQTQDNSNQSLSPSKEPPSHTSPGAGSSSAVADEDAELKTSAEETLAAMKSVRSDLWAVKAALTVAADSSNYSADIKAHQNSIDPEIIVVVHYISFLTDDLKNKNWVGLGQHLGKYQEVLQQAKNKVCDAESALALAVKCNNTAKVSLGASEQLPICSNLTTANSIALLINS